MHNNIHLYLLEPENERFVWNECDISKLPFISSQLPPSSFHPPPALFDFDTLTSHLPAASYLRSTFHYLLPSSQFKHPVNRGSPKGWTLNTDWAMFLWHLAPGQWFGSASASSAHQLLEKFTSGHYRNAHSNSSQKAPSTTISQKRHCTIRI